MIIRVSSPYGTKRFDVNESDTVTSLFNKIKNDFQIDNFQLCFKQIGDELIVRSSKHLKTIGLKHGDMIYLKPLQSAQTSKIDSNMEIDNGDIRKDSFISNIQEDEIDQYLAKQDGKIIRPRNEQFCRHGPSGKCIHCVPLEPFDEEYLSHCNPPIKFMSFHAYLRKVRGSGPSAASSGKYATLENTQCKIKPGCTEHLPWPVAVCTKCQPSAITLNIQQYRHVDNIVFENKGLMDDFLDFWRQTGCQRVGILFGYYTPFDQAPLGIKAVVCAIYEPPQTSTSKSVQICNLTSKDSPFLSQSIMEVSQQLGLRPVGWIFTDLVSSDTQSGAVKHFRGTIDTYFLTAQECITAAYLQNMFPNKCNLSMENGGNFGSKFVTVVVTGDQNNTIHFEGYQVSNQCMALVRDEILVPTYDAPEFGYIKESSSNQYVPDVFCKQKDKYGNTVTKMGRPLPVEFLLVHMTVAFPRDEDFSFNYRTKNISRFPIENRDVIGELQNFDNLKRYLDKFRESELLIALSNIHLLWYLYSTETIPLREPLKLLYPYILNNSSKLVPSNNNPSNKVSKEALEALNQFKNTTEWQTVTEIIKNHDIGTHSTPIPEEGATNGTRTGITKTIHNNTSVNTDSAGASNQKTVWSCIHCTFHNETNTPNCQMCGLPQS